MFLRYVLYNVFLDTLNYIMDVYNGFMDYDW